MSIEAGTLSIGSEAAFVKVIEDEADKDDDEDDEEEEVWLESFTMFDDDEGEDKGGEGSGVTRVLGKEGDEVEDEDDEEEGSVLIRLI